MSCLVYGWQGDLFAEAPKPPASEDKNLLDESLNSTAQAAGNGDRELKMSYQNLEQRNSRRDEPLICLF